MPRYPSAATTLTLTIHDNGNTGGGDLSATASSTIDVAAAGPHAVADTVVATENTPTSGLGATLKANDLGTPATIVSVGNAQHGTVALNNGNPVFTPDKDFVGAASFSYTVSDAASPPPPGTFGNASNAGVGVSPFSIQAGDLNGDGKVDVVTSNNGSGTISVLLGNGDGTFHSQTTFTQTGTDVIALADVNGDGKARYYLDGFEPERSRSTCCLAMAMVRSRRQSPMTTGSVPDDVKRRRLQR